MKKKASAFTPPPEDEAEMVGHQPARSVEPSDESEPAPRSAASTSAASKSLPSYRVGKRNLSAWIDERAFNMFKAMAAEEGSTIQDAVIEMVNREFARKGRPQIAK